MGLPRLSGEVITEARGWARLACVREAGAPPPLRTRRD